MTQQRLPWLILAVLIAVVVKYAVHENEQLAEKTIDAKVTYTRPEGVLILNQVKEIEVRLRGRRSDVAQLNPLLVEVLTQIEPDQIGKVSLVLQRSDVRVPGDFEVVSIEPNRIEVDVERLATKVLPVRALIEGEPAAGALPGRPTVQPSWAEVRGPASRVQALDHLTAPVSIDRRAITFETSTSIVLDDPLIEVQPASVLVKVPLEVPELSVGPVSKLPESTS